MNNSFVAVSRKELLDKIENNWELRRKSWESEQTVRGEDVLASNSLSAGDWLANDWEGRPYTPKLQIIDCDLYLEEAIKQAKNEGGYICHKDWTEHKFIYWSKEDKKFFHIPEYPKVDREHPVVFGDLFASQDYDVWVVE